MSDGKEIVREALILAWQLGQTFWVQSDSASHSENCKADETKEQFDRLVEKTVSAIAGQPQPGTITDTTWCWDAQDPERMQADSPKEFAENVADDMGPGDVSEIYVLCANPLPKRRMRIVVTEEIDGERRVKWEWLP